MRKPEIEKFIARQEAISHRNYMTYQETGLPRYMRAYEKAEDLLDIARMALNAADDHAKASYLKMMVIDIGSEAIDALHKGVAQDPGAAEMCLRNLCALAKNEGIWNPLEE